VFLMNGAVLVLLTLWIRRKGWQNKDKLFLASGFIAPWIVNVAAVGMSFSLAVL